MTQISSPNSLEKSNLHFGSNSFCSFIPHLYRNYKTVPNVHIYFHILSQTSNMHNFVILSPNLVFQESILVKILQALILFNYISPNQPQTFHKLQSRPKLLKVLACKRKGRNSSLRLEERSVGRGLGWSLAAGVNEERRRTSLDVAFPSHEQNHTHVRT